MIDFYGISNAILHLFCRSAVLFKANRFTNCLDDISAALNYSPKPEAEYMILDRKARCYLFLKMWPQATKTFKEALKGIELVEDINKDLKGAFVGQIQTNIGKIPTKEMMESQEAQDMIDEQFVMDDSDFLIKLKKVHDFHPGLSNKVQVMYNDVQGRYTIANETIKAGEVCKETVKLALVHDSLCLPWHLDHKRFIKTRGRYPNYYAFASSEIFKAFWRFELLVWIQGVQC